MKLKNDDDVVPVSWLQQLTKRAIPYAYYTYLKIIRFTLIRSVDSLGVCHDVQEGQIAQPKWFSCNLINKNKEGEDD